MDLEVIKTAIKNLAPSERRRIAFYILELEKDYVQAKYGPQITEDLESVSRAFEDAMEKFRKFVSKG